jgi:hypothetical protein
MLRRRRRFAQKSTKYFILLQFGLLRQRDPGIVVQRNNFALTEGGLLPTICFVAAHNSGARRFRMPRPW